MRHIAVYGCVVLLLTITGYLSFKQPRYRHGLPAVQALHTIGYALEVYASTEGDIYNPQYPKTLGKVLNSGLLTPDCLVLRNSSTCPPSNGKEVDEGKTDFIYLYKPIDQYKPGDPIVFTKPSVRNKHPIKILLADLRTITTHEQLPENLRPHVSSHDRIEYAGSKWVETLKDLFRRPTFFLMVALTLVSFGIKWCFDSGSKPAVFLRMILPFFIPLALMVFVVSQGPSMHTGTFKRIDFAYGEITRFILAISGIGLASYIVVKDRRRKSRIINVICIVVCLFAMVESFISLVRTLPVLF